MNHFLIFAEAANDGDALAGLILIGAVIFIFAAIGGAFKSKPKGLDIEHRGTTTLRPRK